MVAMGTAAQTARVAVDERRAEGLPVGLVAIRTYRPFPAEALRAALGDVKRVVVLDRAVSLGAGGVVTAEVRAALSGLPPHVVGVVAGLGGRDVSVRTLRRAFTAEEDVWIDLKRELVEEVAS
jgi:pyruvate ferredoxin oxidoreductase alpha subunit